VIVLAFEGALGAFSVALLDGEGGLERSRSVGSNEGLERGLGLVAELLDGRPLAAVSAVAVSTGPGGYTGLRIALSYAKAIAFAQSLPLIPVTSYDVLEPEGAAEPVATFVSGRPGRVCARLRAGTLHHIACGDEREVAGALADRLGQAAQGTFLSCAGDWQGAAPRLGERGITVQPCPPSVAPFAVAVARRALHAPAAPSPHAVRADYGER